MLRHNGGFYNTCTLKRGLHRKVDFKTNATYNAHVSQLFPLQSRIVTKGLYNFTLSDQNKLVEIGCSHKKCLLNCSPFWTDSLWEQSHLKTQLFSFASINSISPDLWRRSHPRARTRFWHCWWLFFSWSKIFSFPFIKHAFPITQSSMAFLKIKVMLFIIIILKKVRL